MDKLDISLKFFSDNGIKLSEAQIDELNNKLNTNIVQESFSDFIETLKNWKTSNQIHSKQGFYSDDVSDADYEDLKDTIDTLKTEEDYTKYKQAFDKLCKFCHIVPEGTIITKYDLKKGDKADKNILDVEYSANTKKIHLPDDVTLYHVSTTDNIKELKPAFRGKSQKGYLYDAPRVYFSIMGNMPKFLADYKPTDKTYKYICLDNSIRDVYVDPLVYMATQGAVYVVTDKPIPVEKADLVNKVIKKDDSSKSDDTSSTTTTPKEGDKEVEDELLSGVDDVAESGRYDNYPDTIDDGGAHLNMIVNEEIVDTSIKPIHEMSEDQINALYEQESEIVKEVNASCKTVFDNRQEFVKRICTKDGQLDETEYNMCIKRLGTHAPGFDDLYDDEGKMYVDITLSQMAYVYGIGLDFEAEVAKDLNKNSTKFYYYTNKEDPGICVKFRNNK